jgi:hypothetical protein
MNSMAFSLPANSNSKVDGNQISFRTVDFQLHPPTLTPVFASLDQEMDLTIGSLNFRVGSLGSICLSDSTKSDPSAGKTTKIAISDSLVGSSSKVNSPVSFATMENIGEKNERTRRNHRLDLDLLDVLQRREITPPGTPDRRAIARAARLDITLQCLQAMYCRLGMSSAARPESSSSKEATSSEESGDEEAADYDNEEAAFPASSGDLDDVDSSEEDAP